jgi:hypothetical protein
LDLVKFSITGNVKQIEKLVEKENLNNDDILELRGIQIKVFDNKDNLLNTRMWSPIHYAIYFR